MHSNIADSKAHACQQELSGLEASVTALEQHVAEIVGYIKKENETIPKV
jgi:hypothetical protein